MFNCPNCNGNGIIEEKICPICKGNGIHPRAVEQLQHARDCAEQAIKSLEMTSELHEYSHFIVHAAHGWITEGRLALVRAQLTSLDEDVGNSLTYAHVFGAC